MTKEYKPNAIDIEHMFIINFEGQVLEISNIMTSFEIQESIFMETMKVSLNIRSSVALIEKFPIIGEETLVIKFSTPEAKKREYIFFIDSIDNRKNVNDKTEEFTLSGISTEAIGNKFAAVNEAYSGMPISDIVKKVYDNHIKDFIKYKNGNPFNFKKKKLTVDKTLGSHHIIGTGGYPLDFIKECSNQAESADYIGRSEFLFYENYNGFHFKTIAGLVDETKNPVKEKFYFGFNPNLNQKERKSSDIKNYQAISSLKFNSTLDVKNNAEMGMYGNDIMFFDPITKTYREKTYIYDRDFDKVGGIANKKIISDNSIFSNHENFKTRNAHGRYFIANDIEGYNSSEYIKSKLSLDPTLNYPSRRQNFLNSNITKAAQFVNTISLNIMVPGNSILVAGDQISIFIPENSSTTESLERFNFFFGDQARFLIFATNQVYIGGEYYSIYSCTRDGFSRKPKSRGNK
jgi:hypothetical protein